MKNLLIVISFIFPCTLFAQNNEQLLDSANQAYVQNKYDKAIQSYEKIVESGYESAQLYYNLGNAYFKTNKIAYAILNYERAKKLAPIDEDIAFNLRLANQKIVDKIEGVPSLFLMEWKNDFFNSLTEKQWAICCIISFVLSLCLVALYLFGKTLLQRQLGFGFSILFFVLTISCFFIANHQRKSVENRSEAIVVSPSVTVTGSPDENGTKMFVLHEGTKVNIIDVQGNWIEIKILNGNVGWMKKHALETI